MNFHLKAFCVEKWIVRLQFMAFFVLLALSSADAAQNLFFCLSSAYATKAYGRILRWRTKN